MSALMKSCRCAAAWHVHRHGKCFKVSSPPCATQAQHADRKRERAEWVLATVLQLEVVQQGLQAVGPLAVVKFKVAKQILRV
jgi:hypothetical protein